MGVLFDVVAWDWASVGLGGGGELRLYFFWGGGYGLAGASCRVFLWLSVRFVRDWRFSACWLGGWYGLCAGLQLMGVGGV